MGKQFWGEALNYVVYMLNQTGTSGVLGKTPNELWFGKKAEIRYFKSFGAEVYVHIPKVKRRKLDPKARKGIFIGYDENIKGYRVFSLKKEK